MIAVKQNFAEEAKAIDTMGKLLNGLSPEARFRVMNWAIGAFEISGVSLDHSNGNGAGAAGHLDGQGHQAGNPPQGAAPIHQGSKDIKAFWLEKQAKSNYQKFAVLGYFLEYTEGKNEFSSKDLEAAWGRTRNPLPTKRTYTVALHNTTRQYHYLVKGSKPGYYRVSQRGEQLVVALPNAPKTLTGKVKRANNNRKKKD